MKGRYNLGVKQYSLKELGIKGQWLIGGNLAI